MSHPRLCFMGFVCILFVVLAGCSIFHRHPKIDFKDFDKLEKAVDSADYHETKRIIRKYKNYFNENKPFYSIGSRGVAEYRIYSLFILSSPETMDCKEVLSLIQYMDKSGWRVSSPPSKRRVETEYHSIRKMMKSNCLDVFKHMKGRFGEETWLYTAQRLGTFYVDDMIGKEKTFRTVYSTIEKKVGKQCAEDSKSSEACKAHQRIQGVMKEYQAMMKEEHKRHTPAKLLERYCHLLWARGVSDRKLDELVEFGKQRGYYAYKKGIVAPSPHLEEEYRKFEFEMSSEARSNRKMGEEMEAIEKEYKQKTGKTLTPESCKPTPVRIYVE